MSTQTLNAALADVRWSGNNISSEVVTSANVDSDAEQCTVPTGAKKMIISIRIAQTWAIWIVPPGTAAPVKATPTTGGLIIDSANIGRVAVFDLDPTDPVEVWLGERDSTDRTFDVIYLT